MFVKITCTVITIIGGSRIINTLIKNKLRGGSFTVHVSLGSRNRFIKYCSIQCLQSEVKIERIYRTSEPNARPKKRTKDKKIRSCTQTELFKISRK